MKGLGVHLIHGHFSFPRQAAETRIDLGRDFEPGKTYTVVANRVCLRLPCTPPRCP